MGLPTLIVVCRGLASRSVLFFCFFFACASSQTLASLGDIDFSLSGSEFDPMWSGASPPPRIWQRKVGGVNGHSWSNDRKNPRASSKAFFAPCLMHPFCHAFRQQQPSAYQANCPRIGIVIYGQLFRFIYEDAFSRLRGGLRALIGDWVDCNVTIDVTITVSETKTESCVKPAPAMPPYIKSCDSADSIAAYFVALGANQVQVNILPEAVASYGFRRMMSLVRQELFLHLFQHRSDPKAAWAKMLNDFPESSRHIINITSRQMHQRNLAYRAALVAETKLSYEWSHIWVLREDVKFSGPIELAKVIRDMDAVPTDAPAIAVDECFYCKNHTVLETMMLMSRSGARAYLGKSFWDSVAIFAQWIRFARSCQTDNCHHDGGWPAAIETFAYAWFLKLNVFVSVHDFKRVQARYVIDAADKLVGPCLAPAYYRVLPQERHDLPECPE